MNWFEDLLIVAGVTLDIFADMECQGSLVRKVNKKQLALICALVAGSQLLALFLGYFLSDWYCRNHAVSNEAMLGEIIVMVIFFGLGLRLLVKAVKNERVEEHLEKKPNYRRYLRTAGAGSLCAVLTGIAFGFLSEDIVRILVMVAVLAVVFVVGGMYVGYHMGFAHKTKVYIIGTVLLWAAGVDVLVRSVCHLL